MEDRIQASRSCFQKRISRYIIFVLSPVLFITYLICHSLLYEICVFKSIPDKYFPFVFFASAFHVLFCAEFFSSFMILLEEAREKNLPLLSSRIFDYLNYKIFFFASFLLVFVAVDLCKETHDVLRDGLLIIFLDIIVAILLACFYNVASDYDAADILISQNSEKSIGALWAIGAYKSYYELTLKDFVTKIENFETINNVQVPVKKLIVICPLSCNIEGSLKKCDGLFYKGALEILELDQGGNVNRQYKNSVFGIKGDRVTYVVAECASSLGSLWEKRLSMKEEVWIYHRDCFIQNLKNCLKNLPCIVLVYDDVNSSVPLHRCLLSLVDQEINRIEI